MTRITKSVSSLAKLATSFLTPAVATLAGKTYCTVTEPTYGRTSVYVKEVSKIAFRQGSCNDTSFGRPRVTAARAAIYLLLMLSSSPKLIREVLVNIFRRCSNGVGVFRTFPWIRRFHCAPMTSIHLVASPGAPTVFRGGLGAPSANACACILLRHALPRLLPASAAFLQALGILDFDPQVEKAIINPDREVKVSGPPSLIWAVRFGSCWAASDSELRPCHSSLFPREYKH